MLKKIEKGVCAPRGFRAGGIHCGIRKNQSKKDLALIYSKTICAAAAVYTQNKIQGAPIQLTKNHIADGYAKAILVNSGNANTCNPDGATIAKKMCNLCAKQLKIKKEEIIIASTGIIGQVFPLEPVVQGMPFLVRSLTDCGNSDAAEAIMTTDTFSKECAVSFELGGKLCHVGGMAKGSGMINPNMATMLAFLTGDVAVHPGILATLIKEVADDTFNMVSVDGDTSTNDTFAVLCNGMAGNVLIDKENEDYKILKEAVFAVAKELAIMIARDGEGATKLLTCRVLHAKSDIDARIAAKAVISSSLLKCAMFGKEANWGRILCAIGYSGADISGRGIDVSFAAGSEKVFVCKNSLRLHDTDNESGFDEKKALRILQEKEVEITIDLHKGCHEACAWGCDLTYGYVKINGDYRS